MNAHWYSEDVVDLFLELERMENTLRTGTEVWLRRALLYGLALARIAWVFQPAETQELIVRLELFTQGQLAVKEINQPTQHSLGKFMDEEQFTRHLDLFNLARMTYCHSPGQFFFAVWRSARQMRDLLTTAGRPQREVIRLQADLLRDVLGEPDRPVPVPDLGCWQETILSLAEAAYVEWRSPSGRLDPGRLHILSDLLEETGSAELLNLAGHLRLPQMHVRGCWALEALLSSGKTEKSSL